MTVDMVVDPLGTCSHGEGISPWSIRSAVRRHYGQVQSALSAVHLRGDLEGAAYVLECLRALFGCRLLIVLLHEAAEALHENRVKRGGIDFESVEGRRLCSMRAVLSAWGVDFAREKRCDIAVEEADDCRE